mmetsp:Transcript_10909/g.11052  ORF Transcript_10909/g.11052 Transcript_10909/m.11052 type:complete len:100 (+) Transcript_10909:420-719(+)
MEMEIYQFVHFELNGFFMSNCYLNKNLKKYVKGHLKWDIESEGMSEEGSQQSKQMLFLKQMISSSSTNTIPHKKLSQLLKHNDSGLMTIRKKSGLDEME